MAPSNQDYVNQHQLNKDLKFGRTIYVPYQKLVIISGKKTENGSDTPTNDCFMFHIPSREMEKLPPISIARSSFAAHYEFG